MSKSTAPKINTTRKFPDGLASAHSLLLNAKNGVKGNQKGTRYDIPCIYTDE